MPHFASFYHPFGLKAERAFLLDDISGAVWDDPVEKEEAPPVSATAAAAARVGVRRQVRRIGSPDSAGGRESGLYVCVH